MAEEVETSEIDSLNGQIADLKSVLSAIQKSETTVDSAMDAIAGYVARNGETDGFLVQEAAVENPFHVVIKGMNSGVGGGGDEGDCCTIL